MSTHVHNLYSCFSFRIIDSCGLQRPSTRSSLLHYSEWRTFFAVIRPANRPVRCDRFAWTFISQTSQVIPPIVLICSMLSKPYMVFLNLNFWNKIFRYEWLYNYAFKIGCAVVCWWKGKVKVTLAQAVRLSTGRTAHSWSRVALPFHDHGIRRGWGVSVTPRPLFTLGIDPVPIVEEAGWAPGLVWTGAENLTLTGIRSPDRPARCQSLYQLRYPAHSLLVCQWVNVECLHKIIWSAKII